MNKLRFLPAFLSITITILGGAHQASAQISSFEGRRISDIQYSPAQVLDPADLERVQPLKKGEPLRASDVARAIDGLFATGQFEDIAVEAEPSGDGVTVRFVTRLAYFLGGVAIHGKLNNPPNKGQLNSAGNFRLGTPFHDEEVKQSADAMKRLLESNGLYEAAVTPNVEHQGDAQEVFLTFNIKAGKRAKYEMPDIASLSGDKKLSDNTIIRATGWRVPLIHRWRQVTESLTRKGVAGVLNKYQSQDRLMATVDLKKLDYDPQRRRVKPSLDVNPGPKIKVKPVEAKVSKRVLRRYVPIYQEHSVDTDLLVEGKRNLQDYFQSKGYYDVDIDFRVLPEANDSQTIEYVIAQGQRYKLVRLDITGNHYFRTDVIRERLFLTPASFSVRRGRYSQAFLRKDLQTVTDLYQANGFRDVRVTSSVDKDYQGKTGQIAVTLRIEEGPQWLVDDLTVNGIHQIDQPVLLAKLTSGPGQPFADVNLATDRNVVLTDYYEQGLPSATFKASWQPSGTPHHVKVTYTVTEGERQYVRGVIRTGIRTTRPGLIDKQLTIHAGDPLSPVQQTDVQKRLYDLGVFARVDTAIENPDGDIDHKYLLYNFEEANRYNFALGFGAALGHFGTPSTASVQSAAGTTGFSPAISLDVTRMNLWGLGHSVSARGIYSNLEKRASLSYQQPRFENASGRVITYSLLYDHSLNVRTFASKRQEASAQISQHFTKAVTGLARFSYRRVSVTDIIIPTLLVPQLVQPVRIGMLSANLSQDRRDSPTDPHRGIYNTADLGLAGKFFGSQRSFSRVLLRNATYHQITKSLVFARQTQFGIISPFSAPPGISAQESVPLPERFFGGGADSLRALPYNQAGPRDTGAAVIPGGPTSAATGFPLGGNALFFNNLELRFPLVGANIQGVFFHDMGNVYRSISDISLRYKQNNDQDFNYAVQAVGFGIRYKTPVGPIRLDLAYTLNPPAFVGFQGTPVQLLSCNPAVTSGPGYCPSVRQNTGHFQFFFSIGQAF